MQLGAEMLVSLSEVRAKLNEVVKGLAERPAVIFKYSRPVAAMLSFDAYRQMLDRIDDLEDRLSVYESHKEDADMRVQWEKVQAETGLLGKD